MKNKRITIMLAGAAALLSIPLIAMQFTAEVDWSAFDFAVMGCLLLVIIVMCEIVLRKLHTTKSHLVTIAIIFLAFLFIWAELAVGIVGSPFAGS